MLLKARIARACSCHLLQRTLRRIGRQKTGTNVGDRFVAQRMGLGWRAVAQVVLKLPRNLAGSTLGPLDALHIAATGPCTMTMTFDGPGWERLFSRQSVPYWHGPWHLLWLIAM